MKDGEKLQIHNFIVEKIEMDGMDYMEVRTTDGGFRVMYRSDHPLFAMFDSLEDDEMDGANMLLNNVFAAATIVDVEFQKDILSAAIKMIDRAEASEVDDEEDRRIIEEEKTRYQMEHEIKEEGGISESE